MGTSESYNYRLYVVDHRIPIERVHVAGGYAVSEDRQVVILDDRHREMPPGATGEIGVRSHYLSAGYWRDPALTRRRFLQLDGDPVPVYLTGDLGRLEPDGCLIHLGRRNLQVKIRGYRVELAEVDCALAAAPGVADCAAAVVKNRLGEDQLVGYVVLETPGGFDQAQVETCLAARLPDYMVPRYYVVLESLPLLPTGKVNRAGLPNPFERIEPEADLRLLTRAVLEQQIVSLFRQLLHVDQIGPQSHFLQLGGDSLLTALLMHRVYQSFGVEIDLEDFLRSPTPAQVAGLIQAAATHEPLAIGAP